MENGRYAVGVDLGGTKVAAGVVDGQGRLLSRVHRATEAARGTAVVLDNITRAVAEALARVPGQVREQVAGVGVGAPGTVDYATGAVRFAPNLRWHEVPLRDLLAARLGLPVRVDNDANCAALGEQWAGAARGKAHVLLVTLGTGVGGGLILGGEVYRGAGGFAGEVGHMAVVPDGPRCGCGQRGCLEVFASARAVAARARELVAAGRGEAIQAAARRLGRAQVDARAVILAAQQGDAEARELLVRAGRYLGSALAGLVNLLNPEAVVVGGGLARAGELLLAPAREEIARRALPAPRAQVALSVAALGNAAGMVGAAGLVLLRPPQAEERCT